MRRAVPWRNFLYHVLVAQLNRFGARTRRCSLAVVITKADLLAKQAWPRNLIRPALCHTALRAWLCAVDLRNLVETAEHDFGRVRYFLVGPGMDRRIRSRHSHGCSTGIGRGRRYHDGKSLIPGICQSATSSSGCCWAA